MDIFVKISSIFALVMEENTAKYEHVFFKEIHYLISEIVSIAKTVWEVSVDVRY